MHRDKLNFALVLLFLLPLTSTLAFGDDHYEREIGQWRRDREAALKADDGWLTVSGLFWLRPGEARIGSDPSNDILLPAHAPASVGTVTLHEGHMQFQAAPGVTVTCGGKTFEAGTIHSDADEHPDTLVVGDVKLIPIKRGQRLALRLKDNRSPIRADFAGLRWYPVREQWRIPAKFVAYPTQTKLTMDTIVGETEVEDSPGYVTFESEGKEYRLQAAKLKNGKLWFVFRDKTSGRTTHGGARQLTTDAPRDNVVDLDFNKAINLPCAFIPYATCPLAPKQNRLSLAIEAGELKYEPARSAGESGR
jgi:uncharacterized protein